MVKKLIFKAIFENAIHGIVVLDRENRIEYLNPASLEMFGCSSKEGVLCQGRPVFDLLGDNEKLRAFLQKAIEERVTDEMPLERKDGRSFLARITAFSIQKEGEFFKKVLFIRDVSYQKEQELRYQKLIDNLYDGLVIIQDNKFVFVNQAMANMANCSKEEMIGKSVTDFMPPEETQRGLKNMKKVIETGKSRLNEYKFIKKNGEIGILQVLSTPILYNGRPAIQTVVREVTQQRQIEEALRESEEKFRLITEFAHDAIIMMDNEGNISYWNKAAEKIFGYTQAEVMGKEMHILIAPKRYFKDYKRGLKRFQETGEGPVIGKTLELSAVRKGGEEFPVELSVSRVRIKGKWYAISILRDISQRKKTEEALQRAKKEAEEANQAKSQFLATMSHEIRTPLNALIGMTELLLDTPLTDEQREYAETIKLSAHNLLGLINDILDLSKIEAGKFELAQEEFNLRQLVEDTGTSLAPRASKKRLELLCYVKSDVPTYVIGDPMRLRQVLINLIGNAIKFTEEGEVLVKVDVVEKNDLKATLHFSVSDTGIGIPKDKQEKIFKAFTQLDTSISRKYGGTGLGLAISKEIVEKMGGKMWLESELGKGSTFHFTIPFTLPRVPKGAEETIPPQIKDMRVLIVDDHATDRFILREIISSWGFFPAEARDAASALKALKLAKEENNPYQLILLDKHMPEVNGFELAKKIREIPEYAHVPIILLSSDQQKGDIAQAKAVGISDILLKPVSKSRLYDCIIRHLAGKTEKKAAAESKLASALRGKPLKILLAEDNLINQKLAVRLLEKQGWQVTVANNGKEAVEWVEKDRFDLVLMDVQMPEMDGLTATRIIREKERKTGQHIPIVALTAHAFKKDKKECLAAGMDAYITKPIRIQELFKTIEGLVKV